MNTVLTINIYSHYQQELLMQKLLKQKLLLVMILSCILMQVNIMQVKISICLLMRSAFILNILTEMLISYIHVCFFLITRNLYTFSLNAFHKFMYFTYTQILFIFQSLGWLLQHSCAW